MTAGKNTDAHPGMMGDGTEEQNLNQTGKPDARITEKEVEQAFGQGSDKAGGKGAGAGTGKVDDQVSNDMSDAKATPEDKQPKDNSHNFN